MWLSRWCTGPLYAWLQLSSVRALQADSESTARDLDESSVVCPTARTAALNRLTGLSSCDRQQAQGPTQACNGNAWAFALALATPYTCREHLGCLTSPELSRLHRRGQQGSQQAAAQQPERPTAEAAAVCRPLRPQEVLPGSGERLRALLWLTGHHLPAPADADRTVGCLVSKQIVLGVGDQQQGQQPRAGL